MEDTLVLAADGDVHLVPPLGRLTFCGREPLHAVDDGQPCADCAELAAARNHAQTRARAE